jgi:hypothetical protein
VGVNETRFNNTAGRKSLNNPWTKKMSSRFNRSPSPGNDMRMNETSVNFSRGLGESLAESFAFAAIPRDKYYQVHGEKRTMPKSGNYNPRFSIVERYKPNFIFLL